MTSDSRSLTQRIAEMKAGGASLRAIAEALGCSRGTVSGRLSRHKGKAACPPVEARPWSRAETEELLRLKAEKASVAEMARRLSRSYSAIGGALKRLGQGWVPPENPADEVRSATIWTREKDQALLKLLAEGVTRAQVAERLGLSQGSVARRIYTLRKAGGPVAKPERLLRQRTERVALPRPGASQQPSIKAGVMSLPQFSRGSFTFVSPDLRAPVDRVGVERWLDAIAGEPWTAAADLALIEGLIAGGERERVLRAASRATGATREECIARARKLLLPAVPPGGGGATWNGQVTILEALRRRAKEQPAGPLPAVVGQERGVLAGSAPAPSLDFTGAVAQSPVPVFSGAAA